MLHFFLFAESIQRQELQYIQKPYIPRGLINRGNWCYINAVSFKLHQEMLDQYQYLGNCPPTPPLTQQQSIDSNLGLMLS